MRANKALLLALSALLPFAALPPAGAQDPRGRPLR